MAFTETGLSRDFWLYPHLAEQIVKTKQLQEIMERTGGRIIAKGTYRELAYKKFCPGMYKIFIKQSAGKSEEVK